MSAHPPLPPLLGRAWGGRCEPTIRYRGEGRIAQRGYRRPQFVFGTLLQEPGNWDVIQFSWENAILIRFERLTLRDHQRGIVSASPLREF